MASDANGLYYMRARYYNIDIMRFINQDILTGSIDSSQSLNRYAYVEGNPVNFLDPLGLDEYKVDTSGMHTTLGRIGAAAYIVGGIATVFFPGAAAVIAAAYVTGAIASGLKAGLYINDAIEADTDEERCDSITNFGWNLLTIGTGSAVAVTQIGTKDAASKMVDAVVNAISANWGQWDDL